jgi:tetratricopeptide (TPR) repeat protein
LSLIAVYWNCAQINKVIEVFQRLSSYVDRLGDDPRVVRIRRNHVAALLNNFRYREAAIIQRENSIMAARLGDSASNAFALVGEIHVSALISPKPLHEFEKLKKKAIEAALNTVDPWALNWLWFAIGWEEVHRGRTNEARDAAHELLRIGQQINDPESTGIGLWVLTWIAVASGSYAEALEYSEQSLAVAITPLDRDVAIAGKGLALVLLRRTEEALPLLEEHRRRCSANGYLELLRAVESSLALCKVLQGRIAEGIDMIEESILRYEKGGYRAGADFMRLYLAEVYLQIISRKDKPPFVTLLKNAPILLKATVSAPSRIRILVTHVIDNQRFDPAGHVVGRALMILGLLYKIEKKRALALQHLTEARRILSQFGQTPTLAQVETALAELGQQA